MATELNESTLHPTGIFFTPDRILFLKTPIFTFVFLLGMFGNVSLIVATAKFKSLQKPTNILITILCIYDLIILLLGIPVYLLDSSNMLKVCRVSRPLHVMAVTSIVIMLLTIAIERYTFIVHPMKRKLKFTVKKILLFVLAINLLSMFSGLPVIFSLIAEPELCTGGVWVRSTLASRIILLILHYVIPMSVMLYLYSVSWYRIRRENGNSIRIAGTHFNATYIPSGDRHTKFSIAEEYEDECKDTFQDELSSPIFSPNGYVPRHCSFPSERFQIIRDERRSSLQVGTIKPRSCSVVSTQSVDRHTGFTAPRNIIRSLGTSFSQTQRSVTSLILGVEVEQPTEFSEKRSNQTLLTLKMFIYIIAVFAFCMLPHHLLALIPFQRDEEKVFDIFNIFIYINATSNPYVYGFMNRDYKTGLSKLFWSRGNREISFETTEHQESLVADNDSSLGSSHLCTLRCYADLFCKWSARYRYMRRSNRASRRLRNKSIRSNESRISRTSTRSRGSRGDNCIELTGSTKHILTPLPIIIITPSPAIEELDESVCLT